MFWLWMAIWGPWGPWGVEGRPKGALGCPERCHRGQGVPEGAPQGPLGGQRPPKGQRSIYFMLAGFLRPVRTSFMLSDYGFGRSSIFVSSSGFKYMFFLCLTMV